jgi:DNA-binding MarR family transcriptional regulator
MKKVDAEKLVRHPVRVQIVALLADQTMSPKDLADQTGVTLGTVAYHVRTMEKFGAIRLAKTRPVRGAIEHFYTLRTPAREPIKTALTKMSKERSAAENALTIL